jgi:hypothetical protein
MGNSRNVGFDRWSGGDAPGLVVRVAGSDALAWLVLPVGVLLLLVGLVALGIGTWRAGVLPRWCAVAMGAALPLTFLTSIWFPAQGDGAGDYPGVFVMGMLWLTVAATSHGALAQRRDQN